MLLEGIVQYHVAHYLPLPPITTLIDYVLASNGVFKRAANQHLTVVIPIATGLVRGLATVIPEVRLNYPRVPEEMLETILFESRQAALAGEGPKELLFQLCCHNGRLVLTKPPQQTTAVSIKYTEANPKVIVADIHSHHWLPAEFSAQDDVSDSRLRLYGVVGNIFDQPVLRLRVGIYSDFWSVPVTTLFTGSGPFVDLCHDLNLHATSAT
jgi:PRTRC genetic system protein A